MTKIKNLVGSPFDIETTSGPAILPAYGEIEVELSPQYLTMLEITPAIEIVKIEADPLDQWRDLYREASGGKEPDGRWSEKRLIEEIEKLSADA